MRKHSRAAHPPYAPLFVSDSVHGLTGFPPDRFVEEAEFGFSRVHPDDAPAVAEAHAKALETGVYQCEYRWLTADGRYIFELDATVGRLVRKTTATEAPRPRGLGSGGPLNTKSLREAIQATGEDVLAGRDCLGQALVERRVPAGTRLREGESTTAAIVRLGLALSGIRYKIVSSRPLPIPGADLPASLQLVAPAS